jgi:pimeloyl-ACP methyl ester carboxylesterase
MFLKLFTKKAVKNREKDNSKEVVFGAQLQVKNKYHFVFIHGAGQTKRSWNFILEVLKPDHYTTIEYNVNKPFDENLKTLSADVNAIDDVLPLFLIAHSMGGLYGLHLQATHFERFAGAISMSTPFAGSRTADFVKYMYPGYVLFKDIGTKSAFIKEGNDIEINIPWTQIVTTGGEVPWHAEGNDGTVTILSQKHRADMDFIELAINHQEILVSREVIDIIQEKINDTQASQRFSNV